MTYTMDVNANIEKLYFTVREDAAVKLGWWDPDFGEMVDNGTVSLEKGEVYEMTHKENDVYCYISPEGRLLYSPLCTFLKDTNYVIFPSKAVIEDFIVKVSK